MGIFDDVGSAKTFDSSQYFQPGLYLVDVTKLKHITSRGEKVVIEGTVLGVKSDDERAPEAGETAAQVISGFDASDEKRDYALGDFKAFVQALAGEQAATWSPQQFGAFTKGLVGVDLTGRAVMVLECWGKPLKRDPSKVFTIHKWLRRATPEDYASFGVAQG